MLLTEEVFIIPGISHVAASVAFDVTAVSFKRNENKISRSEYKTNRC